MPGTTQDAKLFVITLLSVQFAFLTWNSWSLAPGWDEWGHLPSGLVHLEYGEFRPYAVNPPVVRSIAAVPVALMGGGMEKVYLDRSPGSRPEWTLARAYMKQHGADCFWFFSIARMMLIPISMLGSVLVWTIARRFGLGTANVAACLWCFSPTVLTFGSMIVPDVPMTVVGLMATAIFLRWIDTRTYETWFGWVSCVGLALGCKSTWIILPGLLFLIWVAYCLFRRRIPDRYAVLQWIPAGLIVLTLFASFYSFDQLGHRLGSFEFVSQSCKGLDSQTNVGNRFKQSWLGQIPTPFPAEFVVGLDIQKYDLESNMPSYLFGEWKNGGWLHYYLVALLVKEPVAVWVLICIATVFWLKRKCPFDLTFGLLAVPGLCVLVLVSRNTGFNHHMRYVMPVLPVLFIAAATSYSFAGRLGKRWVLVTVIAYCISSVSVLPRSYSYFSEVIGGPKQGWKYLGDSNLDWGQDLLTLRDWAKKQSDNRKTYVLYSIPFVDFPSLGIPVTKGETVVVQGKIRPSVTGRWAVFARPLMSYEGEWFRDREPVEMLSPTIRIYEVREDDLR